MNTCLLHIGGGQMDMESITSEKVAGFDPKTSVGSGGRGKFGNTQPVTTIPDLIEV